MATLGGTALTLSDIAKATDPDGKMASIVEILHQTNDMIQDITWIEANDGDTHQTTVRTGLPEPTWRRFNEGVQPSKGSTAQVRVQCGMLAANSVVDVDLADKGGNREQVRAQEAVAHIEGMNQAMAYALLYGDERVNETQITGIMAHYATVNTATAESAENVIDAGGTGSDNASILFVVWGPSSITGIFPKGGVAGLTHKDAGIQTVADANGIGAGTFEAYVDRFGWKPGLCVKDWRQGGRICNIDIPDLRDDPEAASIDLINMMIDMSERINSLGAGNAAIYMPRVVRKILRMQKLEKARYQITQETVEGKPVLMFDGIPVRRSDQMLITETRVV